MSKSNLLSVLMIFILLLSLGVIGFFEYKNYQLTHQLIPMQSTSTHLPSLTTIPNSTVNWKTYVDPNGQFSFKYPPHLTKMSLPPGSAAPPEGLINMAGKNPGTGELNTLRYCVIKFTGSSSDLVSAYRNKQGVFCNTDLGAIKDTVISKSYNTIDMKGVISNNLVDEKNIYQFMFSGKGLGFYFSSSNSDVLDQILSTFKFTH